jgi:hypothetical protein
MDKSVVFYQTFYQYDTLVKVPEKEASAIVAERSPSVSSEVAVKVAVEQQPVQTKQPASPIPSAFPLLKHRMLILVDESRQEKLIDTEALFLDKILGAVGHSLAEADVVNIRSLASTDARSVLAGKLTNHFITFGVPLIKLQIDLLLPPYTPKKVEGVWFLLVDSLAVIEADRDLKKRLWGALQQMFAIN